MASVTVNTDTVTFNDCDVDLDIVIMDFFQPFIEGNYVDPTKTTLRDILNLVAARAVCAEYGQGDDAEAVRDIRDCMTSYVFVGSVD